MKLPLLLAALFLPGLHTPLLAQPDSHPGSITPSLEFIENKGQWDAHARYAAALPSGRLFAETDGLTFALLNAPSLAHHGQTTEGGNAPDKAPTGPLQGHALRLRFAQAAATATLTAETPTAEHRNYFLGADARHWARDVRSFRSLHYSGLWPGIDARVYESADQHLEYDFVLAPGAEASAIVLRHEGADALALDAAGNLHVRTSVGSITEQAPKAWQLDAAGRRQPVACRHVLSSGLLSFQLGKYDHSRALTIDPVVVFSTYSGSYADNWGFTSTYDLEGNLYSGGIAFGVGYPVTSGAFQTTFAAITDIALIKYNTAATGQSSRMWATYLGGSSAEFPTSLVVNSLGELLVLGITSSANYPLSGGAVQSTFRGGVPGDPYSYGGTTVLPFGSDLVVTRLNAAGSGLVGSTFLGGSGNDGLLPLAANTTNQLAHNYGDPFRGDILVDAADNVYIASHTTSLDFPLGPQGQGFQRTYQGGATDGIVLKLNPGLTAITWGGYLGGSASDAAYSIQIEPASGDVYVAGGTLSANFPATTGGYRAALSGDVDGFVARIAGSGQRLSQATYLGTTAYDQAYFLQLGTDGGVYALGQTAGAYPVTPGLYTTANGRQFIHKLSADLRTSQLATVFGSGRSTIDLAPTAFLVDRCDRVYVCGWGGYINQPTSVTSRTYLMLNGLTTGLPTTPSAVQTITDGNDFYLAQFGAGLRALEYATFYGHQGGSGDHVDGGTARFDPRGVVYQSVCSCSATTGFPIPAGAHTFSTFNNSSNCNNAAFVFNFQPNIANAGSDQTVCATAGPQALVGTPAGGIWTGPGVTGSVLAGFVFTPSLALVGTHTLTYTVPSTGLCTTTDTRRMRVSTPPVVTFAPLSTTVFCRATTGAPLPAVALTATPVGGTFSGQGVVNGNFDPNGAGPGTHTITYTYFNGCTVAVSQQVQVVYVSAGAAQQLCVPGPPVALGGSPSGGTWTGPNVTGSRTTGFFFTPTAALTGSNVLTYSVTTTDPATGASCTASSGVAFTVGTTPVVTLTPLPLLCAANSALIPLSASPAGGSWSGPWVGYGNVIGYYFAPSSAGPGTYQLTYTVGSQSCIARTSMTVVVSSAAVAAVPADTVLCPGSTQPFRLRGTPAGGTWAGPGVSGSVAAGFFFTPAPGLTGSTGITYSTVNGSCTATATRRVTVAVAPSLQPTWAPVACAGTRLAPLTLHFSQNRTGNILPTSLSWDFGDGTVVTEAEPTHTYAAPGTYQPRVRVRYNTDRCETVLTLPVVQVLERKVPNIITPNGDGLNQSFQLGPDCPPRLQVFSRWGRLVFEAAAYHDDWSAAGQPDGLYYYLITYPDGHRLKGWVEVVR